MNSDETRSLYQCPVCFDYAMPPVRQCSNGHIVCENCKIKLNICPTCRERYDIEITNLILSKTCVGIQFPCRYKDDGCEEMFSAQEKRNHEKNDCMYMPVKCPTPRTECHFEGKIDETIRHINAHHGDIPTITGSESQFVIQKELGEMDVWAFKMNAHNQLFLAVFEITERKLVGTLRAFTHNTEASKFSHQILMRKGHYTTGWRSRCKPISRDHESIVKKGECFIMGPENLKHFEEDSKYNLKICISKKNSMESTD